MAAAVNAALSCGAAAPVRMGGESLGGTYCLPASAPRENFVGVFKVGVCVVGATPLASGLGRVRGAHDPAAPQPADEEPFAPNNPRAASGRALGAPGARRGVLTGEGFVREAAAFLLDTGGFAAVPPTAVGTLRHGALSHVDAASSADEPKLGSLQVPPCRCAYPNVCVLHIRMPARCSDVCATRVLLGGRRTRPVPHA